MAKRISSILIYEANIANPPTAEVIAKTFKNPTDVIFVREKPQHLLICDNQGIAKFYLSSGKVSRPVLEEIKRPFKAALLHQRKQVWITDCVNKTVVVLNLEGSRTKTIKFKFIEPTGVSFLPALDVVAVCDSVQKIVLLFTKNGEGVVAINLPSEITPVHISSFAGFGNDIFLVSSANILHKITVTRDKSGGVGRNSSAVLEQVAGHRQHPLYSDQDGPAPSTKLSNVNGLWTGLFLH